MVQGLEFRVYNLGVKVLGLGFRVWGLGLQLGCSVYDLGFII
jgi:hypothetical protein